MENKQLDVFWDIRCPKCNERIDIEILVNRLKLKENEKG